MEKGEIKRDERVSPLKVKENETGEIEAKELPFIGASIGEGLEDEKKNGT